MKTYLLLLMLATITVGCKKENSKTRKAPIPNQTDINKLKINQLQILGSHNSYHQHMDNRLFAFLTNINSLLPTQYKVEELDYSHEPFDVQLNTYGMRSVEIDIYNDPNGGLFYNRNGNRFAHMTVESHIDKLKQPGLKVLHIPDIDYETLFYTFKDALQALKDWSDAHPNHLPFVILIESKEETVGDILGFLGFVKAIKFTPAFADNIDTEIKSVFGENLDKIITPDKVRGNYATLEDAVLAGNWPTVGESRGKFIFTMEGKAVDDYLEGHPSLQGRAMFVMAEPGKPEAAFTEENDPIKGQEKIKEKVAKGYLVRTRADEPNRQNKTNNYSQMNAAFSSGAQVVSADYYRADPKHKLYPNMFTDYTCKFPTGELARINPISAADKQNIGKIAE